MDRLTDLEAGARWAPALRALGDERLARMVEGGSDPAFAAIYGRYAPVLQGYCRSLLRDEDEAGDALQNAMLKALQAMRRSGRSGPLRPWLFRIAHNESVTLIRARGRRPAPLDDSLVAGAGDAFRSAAAREQLAALLEDMQHLTEHQRGALVMRELGGLTYDEIGQALDTTPLAARQAVFMARKRLRAGDVAPRRLRPALRQLIPAPGFALLGLFGAGGKALVGTAAVVSVGIGSVELAVEQTPVKPRRAVVAEVSPTPVPKARRRARTTPTPTPAVTAVPVKVVTTAATRTPAAPKVRIQRVAATVTPDATPAPKAKLIEVDAPHPHAREHEPATHRDPAPESTAAPPPAPTAAPVATRPQRPQYQPQAHAANGPDQWRGGRRDCPPEASADAPVDPPVQ